MQDEHDEDCPAHPENCMCKGAPPGVPVSHVCRGEWDPERCTCPYGEEARQNLAAARVERRLMADADPRADFFGRMLYALAEMVGKLY